MGVLQVFIVNRNGGLVFSKTVSREAPKASINDMLRIASTFHSLHEISKEMAPVEGCMGINKIETRSFSLYSLCTLTGVKFVITSTPETRSVETIAKSIYEIYADYVLKNPFYEMDQPVNIELFSKKLDLALTRSP